MSEEKIYWVTTYALTTGIQEVSARISDTSPDMLVVHTTYGGRYFHGEGKNWHHTLEGALARVEVMRSKKIGSLRKQITKLEKTVFSENIKRG